MRLSTRPIETVELAIERENPPTRARAEVDAELFEGGVDPKLAKFGIFLEAPDCRHGFQIGVDSSMEASVSSPCRGASK